MIIEQKVWPVALLINVIQDMQPGFARRPNLEHVGIAQLRTNNISNEGNIDLSEIKYVEAKGAEIEKYGVHKGDVIFNNTNSPELVGRAAYFDLDRQFVLSNHMTRLRVNSSLLDAEFLARYLNYLWHVGASSRWAKHWVNQAAIDQAGLEKFEIPLPPLPEQRRIVTILRKADELRQLRRQANQRAKALLPALFDEMFGDPVSNPYHWNTEPIGKLLRSSPHYGSFTPPSESRSMLDIRVGNIVNGEIDLSDEKFLDLTDKDFERFRLHKGDIILARAIGSADLLGKCAVFDSDRSDVVFDSHIMRLQFDETKILPEYFHTCFTSSGGRTLLSRYSRQSAVQFNVNTKEIQSISIPVPPIDLQFEFRNLVAAFRSTQRTTSSSQAIFDSLWSSLLFRAYTGDLTTFWREDHEAELEEAVDERDRLLGLGTNALRIRASKIDGPLDIQSVGVQGVHSSRTVLSELDPSTHTLLTAAQTRAAYFRPEDLIANHELTTVQAEAGLHVLEALGFVRQIALEGQLVYRTVDAIHESAAKPESLQ